ncbi:hypothetical protein RPATATE_0717 [Rickettsia parkeri str. Tate's Hell]|uniref:Secreted protein n=1 Tax=Rickettsia parkeri str. Tate's Hell TaxID=1359189 RepID=A0ABR5DQC7_RICPA|nr:hypothetical protein RPATATE_0717 [Rickettsia parkeri str. Tate's Hell]
MQRSFSCWLILRLPFSCEGSEAFVCAASNSSTLSGVFIEDLSLLSSAEFFIPSSGVLIDDLLLKFSLLMHIS